MYVMLTVSARGYVIAPASYSIDPNEILLIVKVLCTASFCVGQSILYKQVVHVQY